MRLLSLIVSAFLFVTPATSQTFYGVTRTGGSGGGGTIFKMSSDGTQKTTEHNFAFDGYIGRDFDYCQMVKGPNGNLYGVAPRGGQTDTGVLFEYVMSSGLYEVRYEFVDEAVGISPFGSLVFGPNGNLYGTTNNGGSHWNGTIFEYSIGAGTVVKRADFEGSVTGRNPISGMVLAGDNMFYGVTINGGSSGLGTLYQFDPATNTLTKKKNFIGGNGMLALRVPVLYGGKLYGTTLSGGVNGFGVIYEYNPSTDLLTKKFDFTNTGEGKGPTATMTVVGSLLYGVTSAGGNNDHGTIFEFNPSDGLVSTFPNGSFESGTTGKGDVNVMVMANGKLYGTSEFGGSFGGGTVFEFDLSTQELIAVDQFVGSNGFTPKGGLTLANNGLLYGTTAYGGTNAAGVLFSIDPSSPFISPLLQTSNAPEGAFPLSSPVQHTNGKLYGVTSRGGSLGGGVLYEFDPITKLYQVAYEFGGYPDGNTPEGSLILHTDGYLYGMAQYGGTNGHGVIYQFDPSDFTLSTVLDFDGVNTGSAPHGSLMVADNGIFYGLTSAGGATNAGTLFSYDPSATPSLVKLIDFGGPDMGIAPHADLVQATNGKLYGTTQHGGANNRGVLFEFDIGAQSLWNAEHFTLNATGTGAEPTGSLVLNDDGNLYGLTSLGGAFNAGSLFKFDIPSLTMSTVVDCNFGTTGGQPFGTLARGAGNLLYGFAPYGGAGGWGTIFEFNPAGNVMTKKFDFAPATGVNPTYGALSQVALPPTISALTPNSGPAGSSVTISGTNFSADAEQNFVYFGPVKTPVITASATELEVVVPNGATYGPISVTVGNLTAESTTPFTPTYEFNGWIPGSFERPINKAGGTANRRVVMADLDLDGKPDAILADGGAGTVSVYKNTSTMGGASFADKADFSVASGPYTVAAADLDGDGLLDIVTANPVAMGISILRNESTVGNILFEIPSVDMAFGAQCLGVTTADLNGDGKPEIIAVGGGDVIRIYQNYSSPGSLDFVNIAYDLEANNSNADIWDPEVADVDRDGRIDVLIPIPDGPSTDAYVAILRNLTNPGEALSFASVFKVSAPGFTSGVDVADLESDGMPELIVGSSPEFSALRIFKNLSTAGNISFGPALDLPSNIHVWDPQAGDVNGDGLVDILAPLPSSSKIFVFINENDGLTLDPSKFSKYALTTGGGPLNAVVCDIDFDGLPDIVASNELLNQLHVFKNMNAFPPPIINSVTPPFAEVGESVTISGANFSLTSSNAVYFGATEAAVTGVTPTSLTVTIPSGATEAPVTVITNGLTGTSQAAFIPDFATTGVIDANSFAPKVDESTGSGPQVFAVADMNADGLSDLLVPNIGAGTVSVMENLSTPGSPNFGKVDFASGPGPYSVAIGDIDGDEQRDFVVNTDNGFAIFHHNSANGTITTGTFTKVDLALTPNPFGVALGDIDGDGKIDIVASSISGDQLYVVRNLCFPETISAAFFEAHDILVTALDPSIVTVADLDGDGKSEILVGYAESASITNFSIFQNVADPGFFDPGSMSRIDFSASFKPYSIAVADVDGDGHLDIVTANNADGSVSVLRNKMTVPGTIGPTSFAGPVNYSVGVSPNLVACADVDGDHKPDIITSNDGANSVSVLKNLIASPGALGASSFQVKQDFVVGAGPKNVEVADIDGDDLPDIMSTSEGADVISILLNASPLGVPGIGAIENITTTSFKANWGAVAGATEYRIDVSLDNFASFVAGYDNQQVAGTSVTVSGLTSGLTYKFRVRAANGTGMNPNASQQEVTLMPEVPGPISYVGTPTETSFFAMWNAVSGATGYLVDVRDNSDNFVGAYENFEVVNNSHEVTGLSPGTDYKIRVRTKNSVYTSDYSTELAIQTVPSAPDATAATSVTATAFTANWVSTSPAANYKLDVSAFIDFSPFLPGLENKLLSVVFFDVSGLDPGVTYYYRVRAGGNMGNSVYSDVESVTLIPGPPNALAATEMSQTSFRANWEAAIGADDYHLDVSSDNFVSFVSGFEDYAVPPLDGTSTMVTGLSPGVNYEFRVRASNSSGPSDDSNEVEVVTTPPAPLATAATGMTATSFTANWDLAPEADDYYLDVASNNDFTTIVAAYDNVTVASNSATVSGLTSGIDYYYRVRAHNTSGTSGDSNVTTVLLAPVAPTADAATGITQTVFTASWPPVPGAIEYRLDVSADDFVSNLTGYDNLTVLGTSQEVSGLTAGTLYKYRVRAFNASGTSVASNVIQVIMVPPVPVATPATGVTQSSFFANWDSALGAVEYHFDVSIDDFVSLVDGYNNFPLAGTSMEVTGLTAGTKYEYRVRAVNDNGASEFSNEVSVDVIPLAPEATAATNPGETSFTANWNSSMGATDYRVDVSADDFASIIADYENLGTTGTSYEVTGLPSGGTYMYRVSAGSSDGFSGDSDVITVNLKPAAPSVSAATEVSKTSFTANWSSSNGATNYRVDVSGDDFATNLDDYDDITTTATSLLVNVGLQAGTTYKYRVRAENAVGVSSYSTEISITTASGPPTVSNFLPLGGTIGTSVTVNGTNFTYPLEVDFNNVAAATVTNGSTTSFTTTVPTSGTTGKIKVTIAGESGTSADDFVVDITPPIIQPSTSLAIANTGSPFEITINDAESQTSVDADVYFRSVAGDENFSTSVPLVLKVGTSSTYEATLPSTYISAIGAEYYVEASSYGGASSTLTSIKTIQVNLSATGLAIPYTAFGEAQTNYRIISIPLELTARSVADIFHDNLDASDRKNWRLSHYSNGATNDLSASSLLTPGEGYWLIVRSSGEGIDTGPGKTVLATRAIPYEIMLKPGWNQIGNPYNFNLYWPDVIAANAGESANFSAKLDTYAGGWADSDILKKTEGAFIKNTSSPAHDIVLKIPAQYNSAAGRVHGTENNQPIDGDNWQVEFVLSQGENFNALSGFGMHQQSQAGQDRYDHLTMPRFFEKYIEVNHTRKTQEEPLATDVVPTASSYVWEFDVESTFEGETMVLEWDNSYFGDNQKGLVLWDEQLQLGTDMRLSNSYTFLRSQSRRFKVYFGDAAEVADKAVAQHLVFHNVSPNPTDSDVKVAFSVPLAGDVTFEVYDLVGRKVWTDGGNFAKGYHEVDLTGKFTTGTGMVIVQVGMGGEMQQKRLQIK